MSTLVGFRILDFRAWKAEEGKAGERENFCLTISQAERGGRRKGATFLPLPPFRSRSQSPERIEEKERGGGEESDALFRPKGGRGTERQGRSVSLAGGRSGVIKNFLLSSLRGNTTTISDGQNCGKGQMKEGGGRHEISSNVPNKPMFDHVREYISQQRKRVCVYISI